MASEVRPLDPNKNRVLMFDTKNSTSPGNISMQYRGETISIDDKFALKVINVAKAYLQGKDPLNYRNRPKSITPQQICAILVEQDDPCICRYVEVAMQFATVVEELFVVCHDIKFSLK